MQAALPLLEDAHHDLQLIFIQVSSPSLDRPCPQRLALALSALDHPDEPFPAQRAAPAGAGATDTRAADRLETPLRRVAGRASS